MAIAKQTAFPRPLHGILLMVVGLGMAVMGPQGWLGGIHGREGDLDAAIFFFFAGGCVGLFGLWLTIRSVRRARRSS